MKLCALFILFAAAALAQVPDHSVVNGTTIDIADVVLTVPYGAAETHTVISACVVDKPGRMQFNVYDPAGQILFYAEAYATVKTDSSYCATIVASAPKGDIGMIQVDATRSAQVSAPVPTSESKEVVPSAPAARRR